MTVMSSQTLIILFSLLLIPRTLFHVEHPTYIAQATVAAVDFPTDIAMDCSDSSNVKTVVDPQANVEPVAMEYSENNASLLTAIHNQPEWFHYS